MNISISSHYTIPSNLSIAAMSDGLFINVDSTSGPVNVSLPVIGTYPGVKITVTDVGAQAATNNISVRCDSEETIEGEIRYVINNADDSIEFQAVTASLWQSSKPPINTEGFKVVTGTLDADAIRTLGSAPAEILAAPPAGFFYDVDQFLIMSTAGTGHTVDATALLELKSGTTKVFLGKELLAGSCFAKTNLMPASATPAQHVQPFPTSGPLQLSVWDTNSAAYEDPTGTGTVAFSWEVKYRLRSANFIV